MNKEEIRRLELMKRKLLAQQEIQLHSESIFKVLLNNISFTSSDVVHVFLPILKNNEINTYLLIDHLKEMNVKIVVPVSDFKTKVMTSIALDENTIIKENKYGIPEPLNGEQVDDQQITHVLTPLLAFDEKGQRVGYGGGFYDRFFEGLHLDIKKIGLSLSGVYLGFEFSEQHDVALDYCVTPTEWFNFV